MKGIRSELYPQTCRGRDPENISKREKGGLNIGRYFNAEFGQLSGRLAVIEINFGLRFVLSFVLKFKRHEP